MASAHFIKDYSNHIDRLVEQHSNNVELAMALAVGSSSLSEYYLQGEQHVEMLKRAGLKNGMNIYDLACGSGRTASALKRNNWSGHYSGADVIKKLVDYLNASCDPFNAIVHSSLSIVAASTSLDMIFAWSLFTHLNHEETYIYLEDGFRALKKDGVFVFSFLEFFVPSHWTVFENSISQKNYMLIDRWTFFSIETKLCCGHHA